MCMVLHVPELHVPAVRPPGRAWLKSGIAPALKPPHEAGGRGGESTARNDVSLRASGMGTLHSFIFVINCLSYKCLFFERHVVCYME
ncbi:hypothetical protein E1470_c21690 [Escherichia coli ECC-1470]|nr:hypothetical protein E1470_c21690 [Escherichia coli ECC-1470]